MVLKISKNSSKMVQNSPKWSKNGSKMIQKWIGLLAAPMQTRSGRPRSEQPRGSRKDIAVRGSNRAGEPEPRIGLPKLIADRSAGDA